MTYERFKEILKQYDYSDEQIEDLWNTRPNDDLDEGALRRAAVKTAPLAEILRRKDA